MGSPGSLLSRAKVRFEDLGDLFFGAFSAGGSIVKRLMSNKEYRDITTAVMLSDATYVGRQWVDKKNEVSASIPGFVTYGAEVANGPGDQLFVATASPILNYEGPSGVHVLRAIRRDIEKATGRKFTKLDHFFGIDPAPDAAYQLGNVILAEYPLKPLGHGHFSVAPQTWGKILQPWLDKGKGPLASPGGLEPPVPPPVPPTDSPPVNPGYDGWKWLIAAAAAAGGYLVARKVTR